MSKARKSARVRTISVGYPPRFTIFDLPRSDFLFKISPNARHPAFLAKSTVGIYDNSSLEASSRSAIMFAMIDFVMDLCALCAVQLGFGTLRARRLLAAQALLALCTLLSTAFGPPGPVVQIAVFLFIGWILTGARTPRQAVEAALCLLCAFTAAAGLATLFGGRLVILAPLGAAMLLALVRRRRNIKFRWNVELFVELNGAGDRFEALIDTGNRLRDRRSGLPVLIVEAAAVPNFAAAADRLDPSEGRTLPFGVLGSSGELRCYRPDRVELRTSDTTYTFAPACLVAPFPGRIPGPTRALAPPEFADATSPVHILPAGFKFRSRRFRHGVFQHPSIHLRPGGPISEGIGLLHRRK